MNKVIFHRVEELFEGYVGNISYNETDSEYYPYEISITNKNRLIVHRTDGSVWCDRYVPCTITVEHDPDDNYGISANESTYSILGGMSCGQCTIEEVLKLAKEQLQRYNFAKKHDEQMTLF